MVGRRASIRLMGNTKWLMEGQQKGVILGGGGCAVHLKAFLDSI